MNATDTGTDRPEKRSSVLVWTVSALAVMLCIVAALTIPAIVTGIRSATSVDPGNFRDANIEFFEKLSNSEIAIVSPSSKEPYEVEQGRFKIAIVPLQRDMNRAADQENKKSHTNGAVLVLACYELLHGDKDLGRKLLELLKEHDNEIRYNYPTGKSGLLGDAGVNVYIDEFVDAADKFVKGDPSEKDVLEKPASQHEWRQKQYCQAKPTE